MIDSFIQSCARLDDAALQILANTPKLVRLQLLQKRGLSGFTISGLTNLAKSCTTLRVLDMSINHDDVIDITQESVDKVFKERREVIVMVEVKKDIV